MSVNPLLSFFVESVGLVSVSVYSILVRVEVYSESLNDF